jgi:GDP-L-fucose synthase
MNKDSKIFVAGHRGMVGSSLVKGLKKEGYQNILTRTHDELDLTKQKKVEEFFFNEKPEYVFLAAAKVGGIQANFSFPAEFIYTNLIIQTNVIHSAYLSGVKKLLFLGSSCIYPRDCFQPIKEEYLLSGPLEETNKPYAVAKIAGIKMCESYNRQFKTNFISAMPTNLFGPGDNYDLENSHVLAALIRKFHEGMPDKSVVFWGTGKPRRELLYVDDLSSACIYLMQKYDLNEPINIGTGTDMTILELATLVQGVLGHKGPILWDNSKPDGTPRKLLDVEKIHRLGWKHSISLEEGIRLTYEDYKGTLGTTQYL